VALCIEINPSRIAKRLEKRYLDMEAKDLDEAILKAKEAAENKKPLSIGLCANICDILPAMIQKGFIPDVITDQTSAHDELNGYFPKGLSFEEALDLRKTDPETYKDRALTSMAGHVRAILDMKAKGAVAFDYGNNLRAQAMKRGVDNAMDYPGFVPAYIRDLFCRGEGPFRWAALSGDPEDIRVTDRELMKLFPEKTKMIHWLKMAEEKVEHMGLPARICWLGYGEREKAGKLFNDLVRDKRVKAPIVIGRDHLDCGSVASPYRETEAMKDGSDAVADWALLNALLNAVSGASWVSIHNGGGVGIGYSQHAGQVIVADGTKEMDARLERVLTNDPGIGVARHADAGYPEAIQFARSRKMRLPMQES
jgi:urocanate hydratase